MAVLRHFHLLLLLLASLTVFTSDAYLRKYVPLIIGINEHYGPSSICLVMPYSSERKLRMRAEEKNCSMYIFFSYFSNY